MEIRFCSRKLIFVIKMFSLSMRDVVFVCWNPSSPPRPSNSVWNEPKHKHSYSVRLVVSPVCFRLLFARLFCCSPGFVFAWFYFHMGFCFALLLCLVTWVFVPPVFVRLGYVADSRTLSKRFSLEGEAFSQVQ